MSDPQRTKHRNTNPYLKSKLTVAPCPAYIHLFKVNEKNTRKRCDICSKLTAKKPTRIMSLTITNPFFLVFLMLTLNK